MKIYFLPDGTYQAIYEEQDGLKTTDLVENPVVTRASHVEPCSGGWTAGLAPSGGPVLGPFLTRAEALEAEQQWLEGRLRR